MASALEVLRHANRFHGKVYYHWSFLCENDQPIVDSSGLPHAPTTRIRDIRQCDQAFIVAGFDASQLELPTLRNWLNLQAQNGASIGGISNGAFLLASIGLLNHYSATTHWEDFESFCALFPEVYARYQRFVIDRNRVTCAGGSATLDMFIELVRQDLGNSIALKISQQMLLLEQSVVLPGSPASRLSSPNYSPSVKRAVSLIESGLGQSITVSELAKRTGVSRRELQRLFRHELNTTPSRILSQRRLDRARSLILNTRLPLNTIAESVGFSSQSHLTSSYRLEFGITPAQQRRDYLAARSRSPLRKNEARDW
ncbi:MAG: GlxA family transcriptional regulator [Pseudomonadota bacterium]